MRSVVPGLQLDPGEGDEVPKVDDDAYRTGKRWRRGLTVGTDSIADGSRGSPKGGRAASLSPPLSRALPPANATERRALAAARDRRPHITSAQYGGPWCPGNRRLSALREGCPGELIRHRYRARGRCRSRAVKVPGCGVLDGRTRDPDRSRRPVSASAGDGNLWMICVRRVPQPNRWPSPAAERWSRRPAAGPAEQSRQSNGSPAWRAVSPGGYGI